MDLLSRCILIQARWHHQEARRIRAISRFNNIVFQVIRLLHTPVQYRLPLHQFGCMWNHCECLQRCRSLEVLLDHIGWRITPICVPQMFTFANVWAHLSHTFLHQDSGTLPLVTRRAFAALVTSRYRSLQFCPRAIGVSLR